MYEELPAPKKKKGESFVNAVICEMKEETGLDIKNPRLVGVKQSPIRDKVCINILDFMSDIKYAMFKWR